jgi:anthranilate synthase component 2
MILLIDNYDSFVHNLARHFRCLGEETQVVRNDAISSEEAIKLAPDAIVISPGPCSPAESGVSIDLIQESLGRVPLLGICLGHQAIAAALGGRVAPSSRLLHGRSSRMEHDGLAEFSGLPNPLTVGRYHSLIVEEQSLPAELQISALADDGVIMAIRHRRLPLVGWQFHPESILTELGRELLQGFLRLAKESDPPLFDRSDAPHASPSAVRPKLLPRTNARPAADCEPS